MTGFEIIESSGAPIKAWTRGVPIEDAALKQLRNVASLPFIHRHLAVMPDVHWGMGATVGSVIPTVGAIIPAAVGVDIGCGMMAVRTSIRAEHLPDNLHAVRSAIEAAVPHGRTDNGGRNDVGAWPDAPPASALARWGELEAGYAEVVAKHPKAAHPRGLGHLGTLGTGNHFIELCLDEAGDVWVMLHSGSRGVGNRFGTYFIERAKQEMRRWFINLPDQDLAYFPEGSEGFADYVQAVSWAQRYAAANREVMMQAVLSVLRAIFPDLAANIVSHNVLGKVEGTVHPDQTIFYTAHWDHLGVGVPDARGDRIYNGAIDNADGVASILEIGRQFAQGPAPQRTVIIMSVTAEEKNLLGTEYYASHPLYPLSKTVADINIDALSGSGPARDISVSGDSKGELQDLLVALAQKQGRYFTPDPDPEAGHFFRSDHFPFAKRGVPALSIESGQDLYDGGVAVGKAKKVAYVTFRYHQPADEWDTSLNFQGMAIDDGLAYQLGLELANSTLWPGWKPASEFKAARDATAAERR
jgi:hypothetical protein